MAKRLPTKAQAERKVACKLRPALARYFRALQTSDRLLYALLATRGGSPTKAAAPVVRAILLARLSNDLRAAGLLVRKGYVLQAWTVGASALESAYDVGFIGQDEQRAAKWLSHTDLRTRPWAVFDALRATLRTFELSHMEDAFFSSYSRFSAAKHGNPLLMGNFGISRSNTATRIQVDPFFSPSASRLARYGVAWVLHGTGLAMWSFVHHSDAPVPPDLQMKVVRFAQAAYALAEEAPKIDAPAT